MVAPPLPISGGTKQLDTKDATRNRMRQIRRAEFESHDEGTAALRFLRPPEVLVKKLPKDASIGFYRSRTTEAPTIRYAEFFHERGHKLALPWAAHARDGITFREWKDPFDEDELEKDPFGGVQPTSDAAEMIPDVIFVPGLGFTANCDRIGRGGGQNVIDILFLKGIDMGLTQQDHLSFFKNLDPKLMIKNALSAPLHPGAVKYYKEKGWM